MSHEWYWQHQSHLLGPLTTEELERLIQQAKIGDEDQLRIAGTEEWLTGLAIKALFAGDRVNEAPTPAQAASLLLSQARHFSLKEGSSSKSSPSLFTNLVVMLGNLISACFEWMAQTLLASGAYLPKSSGRWIVIGMILAVTGSILLKDVDLNSGENHRIYHEFSEAIQAIKHVKSVQGGETDWKQVRDALAPLVSESKGKLLALIEKYPNRRANAFDFEVENAEARAALLQVAYELVRILNSSRDFDPKLLQSAESEMQNVQKIFSGAFITQFNAPKPTPPRNRLQRAEQKSWQLDSLTMGFVAVDALLVIGVAVHFLRKFVLTA